MTEWRDDVKKVLLKAGLHNLPITFLFSDTQVPPHGQWAGSGVSRIQLTPARHPEWWSVLLVQVPVSEGGSWEEWLEEGQGAKPSLSELGGGHRSWLLPEVKKAPGAMAVHRQNHTHWSRASDLKDHRTGTYSAGPTASFLGLLHLELPRCEASSRAERRRGVGLEPQDRQGRASA